MASQNQSAAKAEAERRSGNAKMAKLMVMIMIIVGVLDTINGFDFISKGISMIGLPFAKAESTQYQVWESNVGMFFFWVKAVLFLGAGAFGYSAIKNNET